MELKTKVTLKQKGAEAFLLVKQLLVKLKWHAAVDLDLMAFYKTKDGRVGGIYSDNYAGGSLGELNAFPFIHLSGDAGVGGSGGDNEEVLRITKMDDMATIYICTLNFSDASANRETAFNRYDGYVEVIDDKGKSFGVPLDTSEQGTIAVIAKIDNTNFMGAKLINENRILTLDKFLTEMPGAQGFKLSSKIVLKNKGDSIKIKPKTSGTDSSIVVNLNWTQKQKGGLLSRLMPSAGAVDLDLGCLFELQDGQKGAIQALGNAFGAYDTPPYVRHLGDDRTGAVAEGEFMKVNGQHIQELKRILFYAFIYEGVANWKEANGIVSVKYMGGPEIVVHLDEHRDNMGMCALVLFENVGNDLQVSKQVRFFHDHVEMDHAYHWGLRWVAGSK